MLIPYGCCVWLEQAAEEHDIPDDVHVQLVHPVL